MTIAKETIDELRNTFEARGHKPSALMWEGLQELTETLEGAANGKLLNKPYLSSLDPGVGKTTAACCFVKNLLKHQPNSNVGVLFCVARLEEIDNLISAMELDQKDVGVLVQECKENKDLLDKGSGDNNNARVLFTTQQMVESKLNKRKPEETFADLKAFQYKGEIRKVRIWDESMLPAEELTLTAASMASLAEPLQGKYPDLAAALIKWAASMQTFKTGDNMMLPDLEEMFKIREEDVKAHVSYKSTKNRSTKIRKTINTLFSMAMKPSVIRRDGENKYTALDYKDYLPSDFYPVVVLDASGRVRKTYKLWEECRKGVVTLKPARKMYQNLKCHVWATPGGKGAFGRDRKAKPYLLVDGIVDLINSKPSERFLVVTHKPDDWRKGGVPDISKMIEKAVTTPNRVKYLTWGNEKASNDYRDIPNVVLAGTLFYPKALYEVRARASMGLTYLDRLPNERLREIELGEHMNLILQAACRGSCRVSVDGDCSPMNLYVIASKVSGIPASLYEVFPGMPDYQEWNPAPVEIGGKVRDALDYLELRLIEERYKVPFKDVMDAIGLKDASNFNKRIRKHPQFTEGLKMLGLRETSISGGERFNCFATYHTDPNMPF